METLLVAIAASIALLAFWRFISSYAMSRRRLPPGPTPWPILGNIPTLGRLPHRTTAQLARKYGGAVTVWLGSIPSVVITSPELAMEVLRLQDSACASRPPYFRAARIITRGNGVVFVPNNDSWRRNRRRVLEFALGPRQLEAWAEARQAEVDRMVAALRDACGGLDSPTLEATNGSSECTQEQTADDTTPPSTRRGIVELRPYLSQAALNNVLFMIGGKGYPYPQPAGSTPGITGIERAAGEQQHMTSCRATGQSQAEANAGEHVRGMVDRALALLGTKNISDFIPWLSPLDPQRIIPRTKALSGELEDYFKGVIRKRVAARRREGQCHRDSSSIEDDSLAHGSAWVDGEGTKGGGTASGGRVAASSTSRESGRREGEVKAAAHGRTVGDCSLVDLLLDEGERERGEMPSEDDVYPLLLSMVTAGTDTIAKTSEWALAELVRHPQMMARLRGEVDGYVAHKCSASGDRRALLSRSFDMGRMRDDLPFLWAVVKETLRHHPAAPMLVPHFTTAPVRLAGYTLPTGTMLQVNAWAIAHDPRHWPHPHRFDPSRFLTVAGSKLDTDKLESHSQSQSHTESHSQSPSQSHSRSLSHSQSQSAPMEVTGQDFRLLPFGSGRRSCVGMHLALDMVARIVFAVALSFDMEAVDEACVDTSDGGEIAEAATITMAPADPLVVALRQRS